MKTQAKFILSKSKVMDMYTEIKEYSDVVSYSYKTNMEVGKILKEKTDCFFSVHSIESVKQLNYPGRIWYFAQGWNKKEIKELFELSITNFVVDNETDLNLLLETLDRKISLLLRMRLKEHTIHTGKHFVYGMYSKKINELIPKLKKNKNIVKLGIHFHRKTQNVSEWSLKEELEDTIKPWDKIDIVNIGGGIPSVYKNSRPEIIDNIFQNLESLKAFLNKKNIQIIIEPGRYIAAPSVNLEANIINIYDNNIVVDCSIFNSAMDTWISHIRLLIKGEAEEGEAYTIKGFTPDSADIIRYRVYLSNKPKIGDKIIFLNAGAYNFSTDFCNLPKLTTEVVD